MKTEIYYFSGTGNTLHIAKEVIKGLGDGKLISISSLDTNKIIHSNADVLGIIYPVYFLNIPKIVQDFMLRLKTINDTYIFAIDNCGQSYGHCQKKADRLLVKNDNHLSASFNLYMPDNSIIFPTPLEKHEPMIQTMLKEVSNIVDMIKNKKIVPPKEAWAYNLIAKPMEMFSIKFLGFKNMKLNENTCNGCSMCEKICPVNNIKIINDRPTWENNCTMCFACIHWCKKQSIKYMRQKDTDDYQYVNPYISAKELMDNNTSK